MVYNPKFKDNLGRRLSGLILCKNVLSNFQFKRYNDKSKYEKDAFGGRGIPELIIGLKYEYDYGKI